MATVYIVQEMPNHDLAPAMKYGEMKVLLPPHTQIAFSTAPTIRTLRNKLRNFSDDDFLLLAGDPVAIGLACAIAVALRRVSTHVISNEELTSVVSQAHATVSASVPYREFRCLCLINLNRGLIEEWWPCFCFCCCIFFLLHLLLPLLLRLLLCLFSSPSSFFGPRFFCCLG